MTYDISNSGLKLDLQAQERELIALLRDPSSDQIAITITERAIERLRDQIATFNELPLIPS